MAEQVCFFCGTELKGVVHWLTPWSGSKPILVTHCDACHQEGKHLAHKEPTYIMPKRGPGRPRKVQ